MNTNTKSENRKEKFKNVFEIYLLMEQTNKALNTHHLPLILSPFNFQILNTHKIDFSHSYRIDLSQRIHFGLYKFYSILSPLTTIKSFPCY